MKFGVWIPLPRATVVAKLTIFLWDLIRLHHILPGFWILPTFQGHIGQSSKLHRRVARFVAV
jgi:hypothetical protein